MRDDQPDNVNENEIAALVRRTVGRLLGDAGASGELVKRSLLDEQTVRQLPSHSTFDLPPGAIVTPLARQVALERQIILRDSGETAVSAAPPLLNTPPTSPGRQAIAIGADHGGYALKEQLKPAITAAGYDIVDCGTHSAAAVDYPDYAYAVARSVADGRAWRGIIIDGAGIGSCMVANKVAGIRAAMCYDQATAVNSREHNDANVLTLGAGLIGPHLARQIVETWLATEFAGGRHARRVDKIDQLDRRHERR